MGLFSPKRCCRWFGCGAADAEESSGGGGESLWFAGDDVVAVGDVWWWWFIYIARSGSAGACGRFRM